MSMCRLRSTLAREVEHEMREVLHDALTIQLIPSLQAALAMEVEKMVPS